MCMGYAKEISAWVCDDARNQREVMLCEWGQAFDEADDTADSSIAVLSTDSPTSSIRVHSQFMVFSPRTVGAI